MPVDQVARDAAARAQAAIDSHEDICEVRYQQLDTNIASLRSELRRGGSFALAIIVGLLAWFATGYISEFRENMQLRRTMVEQQQAK